MDIRMPGMDGVEATARLTGAGIEPPPRVLVLTTFDLDEYVFGALRAGAAGFLLKDAPRERLLEAIRVVHGGEALLSPSITRRLIEDFAARTDPLEPPTALLEHITPREREVLVLVARTLERRNRRATRRKRSDRQEPCRQHPPEARPPRPRPSRRLRLRARHRHRRRPRLNRDPGSEQRPTAFQVRRRSPMQTFVTGGREALNQQQKLHGHPSARREDRRLLESVVLGGHS
jgi:hypothetical protein